MKTIPTELTKMIRGKMSAPCPEQPLSSFRWRHRKRLGGSTLGIASATIATDDSYIAGYAAAILQHEFSVAKASLLVREGVVIVNAESLGTVDRAKVMTALKTFPVLCEWRSERARLTPMFVSRRPFSKNSPSPSQDSSLAISS